MTTLEILDRLQGDALKDGELRRKLLATRLEKDPLTVFCRLCRELGYELYEMDLVSAGEDFYATMRRSTNGGGENSPKLEGEDDFYELLMASLEFLSSLMTFSPRPLILSPASNPARIYFALIYTFPSSM